MSSIKFNLNGRDLRDAIKRKCKDPILSLSKNPELMKRIAQEAIWIVEPYVPIDSPENGGGSLRLSAHVVYHRKQVSLVWGKNNDGETPTSAYASYQHYGDPGGYWNRYDKNAESYWTLRLIRGTPEFRELVEFATPLIKKEVKNYGR